MDGTYDSAQINNYESFYSICLYFVFKCRHKYLHFQLLIVHCLHVRIHEMNIYKKINKLCLQFDLIRDCFQKFLIQNRRHYTSTTK